MKITLLYEYLREVCFGFAHQYHRAASFGSKKMETRRVESGFEFRA
jgi:hypothetical protein